MSKIELGNKLPEAIDSAVLLPWLKDELPHPTLPEPPPPPSFKLPAAENRQDLLSELSDDPAKLDKNALISLSIALDILTTKLSRLAPTSTILQDLTQELLRLGILNGLTTNELEALLLKSLSKEGQERGEFVQKLSKLTAEEETAAATPNFAIQTPTEVAEVLKTLAAATDILINEAKLTLAKPETLDYFHA